MEPRVIKFMSAVGAAVLAALILPSIAAADFTTGTDCQSDLYTPDAACPFQWGVASGDPLHDRVILWTAVDVAGSSASVLWRVATDEAMTNIISTGTYPASAAADHTVNIDQAGLSPNTTYYYQFHVNGYNSIVGRTRTLPAPNDSVSQIKLALVSCTHMAAGFFNVYDRVADHDDLNAVVHLGDYYYEYGPKPAVQVDSEDGYGDNSAAINAPERSPLPPHEATTLDDYRTRHKQYKSDPALQRAHQAHPFITIWDDHESTDDSFRLGAKNHQYPEEGEWFTRKSDVLTAYYEWMPIRSQESQFTVETDDYGVTGTNEDPVAFRSFRFGQLASLSILDSRLHMRDKTVNQLDPSLNDPSRTMLGEDQRNWLFSQLGESVQWKLIGQQTMMGQLDIGPVPFNIDQWDGYPAERALIHDFIKGNGIDNTVVLTGDIHTSWAIDITDDPKGLNSGGAYESFGVEFVTPAVTSPGIEAGEVNSISIADSLGGPFLKANNPHIQFADFDSKGYAVVDLTTERARSTWYFVDTIDEVSPNECIAKIYETPDGINRLREVGVPVDNKCPQPAGEPGLGAPAEKITVIVAVVDSLMPEEIGGALTPTPFLTEFRDNSTWYTDSRSVLSAETIPNHVAMMTGVYPEKSGIPTNAYWDRQGTPEARDLSLPSELEAENLFTQIRNTCPELKTAAALSKDYLYEVFSECGYSGSDCGINNEPDFHFEPSSHPTFLGGPIGLTPDVTTMNVARSYLPDVDFLFINLGQVDRTGHGDETGNAGVPLARNAVLQETDNQLRLLKEDLVNAGRWDTTIMIIASDHGMDWSLPPNFINLSDDLELLAPGKFFVVQNGGSANIYLRDANDPLGPALLKQARDYAALQVGVADAWYVQPNAADPGQNVLPAVFRAGHENFGDVLLSAQDGWRFSEPSSSSNPIPGNHGHKPTLHNTMMVGGGAMDLINAQRIGNPNVELDHFTFAPEQSENVDIAPTVAWLLGMDTTGFDGRPLTEAFSIDQPPTACGQRDDDNGGGNGGGNGDIVDEAKGDGRLDALRDPLDDDSSDDDSSDNSSDDDSSDGSSDDDSSGDATSSGTDPIDFRFHATRDSDNKVDGFLFLQDGAAGITIDVEAVTYLGPVTGACGSISDAANVLELSGIGAITNGGTTSTASFRACVSDADGWGQPGGDFDRFYLTCVQGCDYRTSGRAIDDVIDQGNIEVRRNLSGE